MPLSLSDLPADLLVRVAAQASRVEDLGRLEQVCRIFAGGPLSVVELALRERAAAAGDSASPPDEWAGSGREWLVFGERRRRVAQVALVAAGAEHTAFVDAEGRLWTCGRDGGDVDDDDEVDDNDDDSQDESSGKSDSKGNIAGVILAIVILALLIYLLVMMKAPQFDEEE